MASNRTWFLQLNLDEMNALTSSLWTDSGSDLETLTGGTMGIVVANHSPEIAFLKGRDGIYFASQPFARGVLEGLNHFERDPGLG